MPSKAENDQVRVVELDVHCKPNCIEVDHRKWNPLEEGIPGNASKLCQAWIKEISSVPSTDFLIVQTTVDVNMCSTWMNPTWSNSSHYPQTAKMAFHRLTFVHGTTNCCCTWLVQFGKSATEFHGTLPFLGLSIEQYQTYLHGRYIIYRAFALWVYCWVNSTSCERRWMFSARHGFSDKQSLSFWLLRGSLSYYVPPQECSLPHLAIRTQQDSCSGSSKATYRRRVVRGDSCWPTNAANLQCAIAWNTLCEIPSGKPIYK